MEPENKYHGQSVTALEVIDVMKDLHKLMKKNGNSKDAIATVDKIILATLGAPTLAETVQGGCYMHVARRESD